MSSVEIIGKFGDVIGKTERMIAHQGLGARGLARFERLNDMHVIADRAVGAVFLADRFSADHAHVGKEIFGQLDQDRVAAQLDDGLVKFDIDFRIFVQMSAYFAILEGGEHAAQQRDRAAMLSSAAQAVISSMTSRLDLRTT